MKQNRIVILLLLLFSVLMSIPYLVPGLGAVALVALVPLLCAERLATQRGIRRFFWWYYAAFALFNLFTTWWVCKATVGGGIFASLANALYMSILFEVFRISKKRFNGAVPYIFLSAIWIAWERFYLTLSQISWPWLVFGNAFGRTTSLVQWYEYTGLLGGSLWVWAANLAIFGVLVGISEGRFSRWNRQSISAAAGLALVIMGPVICSKVIYSHYEENDEGGTLEVAIAQSNFNPYEKLSSVPQSVQNKQAVDLFAGGMADRSNGGYPSQTVLLMLPETFCSDIWKDDPKGSSTWRTFDREIVQKYPNVNLLFGASTHRAYYTANPPSILARRLSSHGWYHSYNSAYITDGTGRIGTVDKTKLVVGTELTPYPKIFAPLDDKLGGLMGRCIPQGEARTLDVVEYDSLGTVTRSVPVGVPICYESIYPEFCAEYVQKGAQAICVITNDGWWGNTAGYRQHFSYSRLRAIELRKDIARCANTGISGIINQRGDVVIQSKWWTPDLIRGEINLNSEKTFFVKYGDITGRICSLMAVMLLLALIVKSITKKQ